MLIVTGLLVLIALHLLPAHLGLVLVGAAAMFEVAEKGFWLWYSRRIPLAVGVETMLGRPVTVISPCRPDGRVRFGSESWMARCLTGAGVGESLIIDGVENLTLVVSNTRPEEAPRTRRTPGIAVSSTSRRCDRRRSRGRLGERPRMTSERLSG